MTNNYMLTTVDNPWNPHTHYNEWVVWDQMHQYYTQETLGRICLRYVKNIEDDEEMEAARLLAIDDMLDVNLGEMYVKIYKNDKTPIIDPEYM